MTIRLHTEVHLFLDLGPIINMLLISAPHNQSRPNNNYSLTVDHYLAPDIISRSAHTLFTQ